MKKEFCLAATTIIVASQQYCNLIVNAFQSPAVYNGVNQEAFKTSRSTSLQMSGNDNNIFSNIFKNFMGSSGDGDEKDNDSYNEFNGGGGGGVETFGMTRICTIPVKSIKIGGLRLFIQFYLMGQQNTPTRGSWKATQPTKEEHVLEMYYQDMTGMLSISFLDDVIRIERCGSNPSTKYLMQEAVIIQGILNELHICAFEESVPESDRLLIPQPIDAIEKARDSLAFG